MRYTRNAQLCKSWKGNKNLKISEMRSRMGEIDKTFKWHREWNNKSNLLTWYDNYCDTLAFHYNKSEVIF